MGQSNQTVCSQQVAELGNIAFVGEGLVPSQSFPKCEALASRLVHQHKHVVRGFSLVQPRGGMTLKGRTTRIPPLEACPEPAEGIRGVRSRPCPDIVGIKSAGVMKNAVNADESITAC